MTTELMVFVLAFVVGLFVAMMVSSVVRDSIEFIADIRRWLDNRRNHV